MKNKGMWILSALTALAVAAAVFDFQWEKVKEEKKTADSMVFAVKPEQVHEFTMVFTDPAKIVKDGVAVVANKTTIAFENGKWTIKAPIEEIADQEQVRTFVEQLTQEKAQEVGGQKENIDWANFGLDSPKGSIAIKDTSGKVTEIQIASRRNFQNQSYLRRNQENKVLLGGAAWYPKIEKKFFEFRDKRPLRSAEQLAKVTIRTGKDTFEFISKDTKWSLANKPKWKLDQEKVRDALSKLTGGSLTGYLAEGKLKPEDLKLFQKPTAEITAEIQGKKWTAKIAYAQDKENKNAKNFQMWISEPSVIATIAQADAEKLAGLHADSLRDRQAPFEFRKADAQKIEIQSAKSKVELEKKDKAWKIVSKSDPKLGVDEAKIPTFVDRLSELEAMEFQGSTTANLNGEKKISVKDASGKTLLELALSNVQKRKIDGVDRSIVTAKSNLIDESMTIDEIKVKDLGLDEMLSPRVEATQPPAGSPQTTQKNEQDVQK